MAKQHYIPIIELRTKRILGLYNLGENVEFTGAETTFDLQRGPINLVKYTPEQRTSNSHEVSPWYMAAVFTHEEYVIRAYRGHTEFVDVSEALPNDDITVTTSVGIQQTHYNGPILDGIEGNFAVGARQHIPAQ